MKRVNKIIEHIEDCCAALIPQILSETIYTSVIDSSHIYMHPLHHEPPKEKFVIIFKFLVHISVY